MDKKNEKWLDLDETLCWSVFKLANYESELEIQKLKMAD